MLAELQTQLKEKQADIELAASLGQALLEEIDFLKKKLNSCSCGQDKEQSKDKCLTQERKFSTPKSSRRLKNSIESQNLKSEDGKKELMDTIESLKEQKMDLKKKFDNVQKRNDLVNENCWNLELENQNLLEKLKENKALLDKTNESILFLTKQEQVLLKEIENIQSLYIESLERNKKIESSLENLKKKNLDKDSPVDTIFKQVRSIHVQVSDKVMEMSENDVKEIRKEAKICVNENFVSTLSQLQSENAMLYLKNDELIKKTGKYTARIQDLELEIEKLKFKSNSEGKYSQTDLDFRQLLQLSDTAQIVLMENELKSEWEMKRHIGIQFPSIIPNNQSMHELLIRKKDAFKLETRNAESCIEDNIQDDNFAELSETSERISKIHTGPEENMIDALVYTMIGSWKYNRNGKNPKLRYFWINPYSRTLHWANASPSQGNSRSATKVVPILSVTWNEEVPIHKNYSPSELDSLDVTTNGRVIRLQPLNWTDRDIWIAGLTVLLRRSKTTSLTEEVVSEVVQNKIRHEQSCAESKTSSLGRKTSSYGMKSHQSSPRKSISHRRSMTIIANEDITPTPSRFTFNAL